MEKRTKGKTLRDPIKQHSFFVGRIYWKQIREIEGDISELTLNNLVTSQETEFWLIRVWSDDGRKSKTILEFYILHI